MTIEGHEEILGHAKCIKQFVQIVERNVKFLSSRQRTDQYTVKNVTRNIGNTNHIRLFSIFLSFFISYIVLLEFMKEQFSRDQKIR